jgi:hypothetical protein
MHGAFHGEELVLKAWAGFANGHMKTQLGGFSQAQLAVLHGHNHRGNFFARAAERVIHDDAGKIRGKEKLKRLADQTNSVASTHAA